MTRSVHFSVWMLEGGVDHLHIISTDRDFWKWSLPWKECIHTKSNDAPRVELYTTSSILHCASFAISWERSARWSRKTVVGGRVAPLPTAVYFRSIWKRECEFDDVSWRLSISHPPDYEFSHGNSLLRIEQNGRLRCRERGFFGNTKLKQIYSFDLLLFVGKRIGEATDIIGSWHQISTSARWNTPLHTCI